MQTEDSRAQALGTSARRAPISVVIPCYRCRNTIGRALASIAAQTCQPHEILLIDDYSLDGTLEYLRELEKSDVDGCISVIALPANVGPASARNMGWNMAQGDFVAFLDADDSWHPRKLELQWSHMHRHPLTVLCGHSISRTPSSPHFEIDQVFTHCISPQRLLFSNPIAPTSAMVRRELSLRFREGHRHMEDHLLWMEIAFHGNQVDCINAPLAYQYKAPFGEGGLSAQLWSMERADLNNYRLLWQSGKLGTPWLLLLWPWSAFKFLRRLLISAFPRLLGRY